MGFAPTPDFTRLSSATHKLARDLQEGTCMLTVVVIGYVAALVGECVWLYRYFRRCERSTDGEATKTT